MFRNLGIILVLVSLTGHNIYVYLDDIIIQGINLMDQIDNGERVFLRFQVSKTQSKF